MNNTHLPISQAGHLVRQKAVDVPRAKLRGWGYRLGVGCLESLMLLHIPRLKHQPRVLPHSSSDRRVLTLPRRRRGSLRIRWEYGMRLQERRERGTYFAHHAIQLPVSFRIHYRNFHTLLDSQSPVPVYPLPDPNHQDAQVGIKR